MDIIPIDRHNAQMVAPLVASFRVALKAYKGICAYPDDSAGLAEIEEYLEAGFPAFAAIWDGAYVGYVVCRVDAPNVWMESIFVSKEYRRKGVASALLHKAEAIAASYGGSTLYHYVHPNNERMISFLRKHGYTVLNLIELRKPYPDERLTQKIQVGEHEFDY